MSTSSIARTRAGGRWLPAVLCGLMLVGLGVSPVSGQSSGREKTASKPAATRATIADPSGRAIASSLVLAGDDRRTQVRLAVDRPIVADIFTLSDPYRAIVDIADLDFDLPAAAGMIGRGLVSGWRYGQFEAGRSRIVLDTSAPVRIENAQFVSPVGREPGHLTFELVQVTAADFVALSRAGGGPPPGLRSAQFDDSPDRGDHVGGGAMAAAGKPAPPAKSRPVIVIDPGHGGIDPGTVAASHVLEKNVVLAVARLLAAQLTQTRRFDVVLTRRDDVFVSLDQRLAISQRRGADLFISLHADALAEKELARAVRGATVYTLSDRASDEAASKLAEKENAADSLAGLDTVPASDEDKVRHILVDLVARETSSYAAEFRHQLVAMLRGRMPLSKDPLRSAAFKVLKQPETPSVLIELGYMSNSEDLARLTRPDWQAQVAGAIAAAVDTHFSRRLAKVK